MFIPLESNTKNPEYSGFSPKIIQLEQFYTEYTKNLGYSMKFFCKKSGKSAIFSIKLTSILTNWVENSEKSEFSAKLVRIFKYLLLQKFHVVQ